MTTAQIAARLVALCKDHKRLDAMEELYAEDIVSVEANSDGPRETSGKDAVIGKSKEWEATHEIHRSTVEGPYLGNDKFAVVFGFKVTQKATGLRSAFREVAVYTVRDSKISRQEFFYRGW